MPINKAKSKWDNFDLNSFLEFFIKQLEEYKGKFINFDNELNEVADREGNKMIVVYSKFKLDRAYETDEKWDKVIEDLSSIKDIKTIVNLIGQTNLLSEMSDYSGESIVLKDLGDFYSEFESSYFIFFSKYSLHHEFKNKLIL